MINPRNQPQLRCVNILVDLGLCCFLNFLPESWSQSSVLICHIWKLAVVVVNHSNQSSANPCGHGCGWCCVSFISQSISDSVLVPKEFCNLLRSLLTLDCSVSKWLSTQLCPGP